jgi:hypothetical protein
MKKEIISKSQDGASVPACSPPLALLTLIHMNLLHTLRSYLFNITCNVIIS